MYDHLPKNFRDTYIHVHSTYEGKSTLHLTAQLVQLELWLHLGGF